MNREEPPEPEAVRLDYGEAGLDFRIPAAARGRTEIVRPRFSPPVPDEEAEIVRALRQPVAGPPLRERVPPGAEVAISICDGTRPQPRIPMLRALLEEMPTPPERVTLLVATGTHRPPSAPELEAMLGSELLSACEVVSHDCRDDSELAPLPGGPVGVPAGVPVRLQRRFLAAPVRITTGFVEPHFFAGFSGGPKMVAPGLAALETILALHDGPRIAHPRAVFGVTEGNPIHDPVREIAAAAGVTFGIEVLLDGEKRITCAFGGDLPAEHAAACARSRREAMQRVEGSFEVVVTTNSGFPLDQNLYQAVKGMSAAARIVAPGGLILAAAECRDGVPAGGAYAEALSAGASAAEVARQLAAAPERRPDDWQVQVHCRILEQARVGIRSALPDETVRAAHLEPVADLAAAAAGELARRGAGARLALLPHGPITIPYRNGAS